MLAIINVVFIFPSDQQLTDLQVNLDFFCCYKKTSKIPLPLARVRPPPLWQCKLSLNYETHDLDMALNCPLLFIFLIPYFLIIVTPTLSPSHSIISFLGSIGYLVLMFFTLGVALTGLDLSPLKLLWSGSKLNLR